MLVYFAIFLVVLLGFCGLAVDVGRLELRSVELQSAADAGALSGAAEWAYGNFNGIQPAAYKDALAAQALNGYPSTTAITTQVFANTGPYASNFAAVQTSITQSVPTIFLRLLPGGATAATVNVRAVALPPPCMYFFGNPVSAHAQAGVDLSSAGIRNACPLYTKPKPAVDGFSSIYNNQVETSVAGSGNVNGGGGTYPAPFYNFPIQSDPLAYVTAPPYTGCDNAIRVNIIFPGQTLQPGRYCGLLGFPGISVSGTSVTLAPGLYIITGGASFVNASVTGTGVTMYFTRGGLAGYGTFYSYNTNWNVSAPVNSSLQGIPGVVLMNDRNWVGGNEDFVFDYGNWYGDGVMYTTGTGIYDNQTNMSAPNYFNIVTANLYNRFATIYASANYATVKGGSPLHNAVSLVQ